jgi:hypothetical protein
MLRAIAEGLRAVGQATADVGRRMFGGPPLGPSVPSQFSPFGPGGFGAGLATGPWSRLADAQWLGPFTPTLISHSIRRLMRRDPQIGLGLAALKSPFFGIEYRAVGGNKTTQAFLKRVLLESPIFDHLKWSCLNSLDFGYQTHELVWDVANVTIDPDGDGGASPTTYPSSYVLSRVRDLDPDRVEILVDAFDEIAAVKVGAAVGTVSLPAQKVLHAVHQQEFDNHLGESILDRVYNHWHWVNVLYLLLNRYLEQRGNPPLIGTAPNEVRVDEHGLNPKHCLKVLAEQMAALRSGGACALPFEIDEKGNLKWKIDVLQDGGRTETFITAIHHYEGMKLRGLYIPERIATQDTQTGSFAMVKEHVDVFFSMLEVIKVRTLLDPINRVATLLQKANFGESTPISRIEGSEISRLKHQLLGDIVTKIIALPHTLPNGKVVMGSAFIDVPKSLEAVNVPRKPIEEVVKESELAVPPEPVVAGGSSGSGNGGGSDAGDNSGETAQAAMRQGVASVVHTEIDNALSSFRRDTDQALSHVAHLVAATAPRSMSAPEIERLVKDAVADGSAKVLERVAEFAAADATPAQPPVVNNYITNNVPPSKIEAPIHHTSNVSISEGAVKVENNQGDVVVPERSVTVSPAAVNVDVKAEIRGSDKKIVRGPDGRITDIKTTEPGGP